MADIFGGIALPVVPVAESRSVSDPLLDVTLEYFRAVMNHHALEAWQVVAPNMRVVESVSANDPEDVDFNDKELPRLYAWRTGSGDQGPERLAEDVLVVRDRVMLFWVLPPARQEFRAFREQITAGLAKTLHVAIENGHDPAWVAEGDPDPNAVRRGSIFPRHAGWSEMRLTKWEDRAMVVQVDQAPQRSYPAMQGTLEVVEVYAEDITKPQYGPASPHGLDQRVFDGTGTLLTGERVP